MKFCHGLYEGCAKELYGDADWSNPEKSTKE